MHNNETKSWIVFAEEKKSWENKEKIQEPSDGGWNVKKIIILKRVS